MALHQANATSTVALLGPLDLGRHTSPLRTRRWNRGLDLVVAHTDVASHLVDQIRRHVEIEPHSAELEAGDTVYVPPRWWLLQASPAESWSIRALWSPAREPAAMISLVHIRGA
ncbi:MAG: hypothetical protein GY708_12230 [Actinomycetia bacterium]|nr:hypothetical protein [Actinomycetes bacterium]MCP4958353.1 hypothetical protein [Actinomycetes bacterium]